MKILLLDPALSLALNAAELPEGCEVVALNFELPGTGGAPEWIELIPAGPMVVGRDGRSFLNDDPERILAAFAADGRDLPLDWEHATELRAPNGLPAPAAAWGKELALRDGAIWGRFEYTERGLASVASREYRYVSPVFVYEKISQRIVRLTSVGLTNQPNLRLSALNHQQQKESSMDIKALLAKLGLPETATLEQALNALRQLQDDLATARNRAETPSLDKFVPRADYDQALSRAANAEQTLADQKKAELETAINNEVEAAVVAGKVTPATADYHKASCRQEGGLERFREFVKAAPVIAAPSGLDNKQPDHGPKAMNAEQAAVAAMFGNSAADLEKYGK